MRTSSAILLASCALATAAHAQGFRFSTPAADGEAAAQAQRQATVSAQLATPCRDRIRNRKIMVLMAEERNGVLSAGQGSYSRHVEAVNARLQAVGLKTYTPGQIRRRIFTLSDAASGKPVATACG